jgi:hypothetical protein
MPYISICCMNSPLNIFMPDMLIFLLSSNKFKHFHCIS